uniref:Uncharacterized protein n=1 Tax=Rhizophora mucronata TaxID=61149 RepID=A0A2P2JAY2_RHIMU
MDIGICYHEMQHGTGGKRINRRDYLSCLNNSRCKENLWRTKLEIHE